MSRVVLRALTNRFLSFCNPNLVLCQTRFLCNEEVKVDFTVLQIGDHVHFYEPHRAFGDDDAFHTAEILSIANGEFPLVLSPRFVLSRQHRVRKVVPGVSADDSSEAPLEVRPHWSFCVLLAIIV